MYSDARTTGSGLTPNFHWRRRSHKGRPLFEAIVLKAREAGLAGATVLRGPMSFGKSSTLHTAKVLRLSEDLPIVIEIVDTQEKIDAFLDARPDDGIGTFYARACAGAAVR